MGHSQATRVYLHEQQSTNFSMQSEWNSLWRCWLIRKDYTSNMKKITLAITKLRVCKSLQRFFIFGSFSANIFAKTINSTVCFKIWYTWEGIYGLSWYHMWFKCTSIPELYTIIHKKDTNMLSRLRDNGLCYKAEN